MNRGGNLSFCFRVLFCCQICDCFFIQYLLILAIKLFFNQYLRISVKLYSHIVDTVDRLGEQVNLVDTAYGFSRRCVDIALALGVPTIFLCLFQYYQTKKLHS